jgi:hypothetical protein
VVCINEEEVEHDRAAREAIVAGLREQLRQGDKSLVRNEGYRRFLKIEGEGHFVVDEAKIEAEARFDGTWVLRTNYRIDSLSRGFAVQTLMARGAVVSQLQIASGNTPDLPSLR